VQIYNGPTLAANDGPTIKLWLGHRQIVIPARFDPIILIYELDMSILKMYLHTRNGQSKSKLSKVWALQIDSASFGWEDKGRYGSFRKLMNMGCAGKTVKSLENACHT